MRFRPASLSDIPRLGQLALASKGHWGYSARQLEQWREDLTPRESWLDTGPFVVAENDAGVIGFYTLAAAGNGACGSTRNGLARGLAAPCSPMQWKPLGNAVRRS